MTQIHYQISTRSGHIIHLFDNEQSARRYKAEQEAKLSARFVLERVVVKHEVLS